MKRKVWVELPEQNVVVTEKYLQAIGKAYQELGYEVEFNCDVAPCGNRARDVYVVAVAPSVMNLWLRGARNIVFWAQGVWPEESLLRNDSRFSYWACGLIEKAALKHAGRVFCVSEPQKVHYERKYAVDLDQKTFVMPCSNARLRKESFYSFGKYTEPVFVYAGSLSKYQCIEEMLRAFKAAKRVIPSAKMFFYTSQTRKARELIDEEGLSDVFVDYLPPEELDFALARAKYGFVIRDNSIVNRVATPTKISSYIANGVIPVFSDSIEAFAGHADSIPCLPYSSHSFAEDLLAFEKRNLCADDVYEAFSRYFDKELSLESKVGQLKIFLGSEFCF